MLFGKDEATKKKEYDQLMSNWNTVQSGGYFVSPDAVKRQSDFNQGYQQGQNIFVNDPQMQDLLKARQEGAKGYEGEELGAMRELARGETAGQRNSYLSSLSSRLAKGGVGGARGAAVRDAASQGYAKTGAEQERKMLLDSASMKRQGQNDLQDFIFRQKYGTSGLALAQQQQGVAERTQDKANAANSGGGGSWLCSEVHKHSKFSLTEFKTLAKLKVFALENSKDAERYFLECHELVKSMNENSFDWIPLKDKILSIIAEFKDCPSCALKKYEEMTHELIDLYKPELKNG